MTQRARDVLVEADWVVGYRTYLKLLGDLIVGKKTLSSGMCQEIDRCREAIRLARQGQRVALVSSGDPGIYGMAGVVLELLVQQGLASEISFEVVPGVTSATAAAASLGAPLMHDFAVISLSDLLTPWEVIEKRIALAAEANLVIVLYNPASKKRRSQINRAREIILAHRSPHTPVGIVRNAKRGGEEVIISTLDSFPTEPIDMFTTVIIGNDQTFIQQGLVITPRGYRLDLGEETS